MKLEWDHFSDQPAVIKDRKLKKKIYKKVRWDSFKLFACNIVMYPICLINFLAFPARKLNIDVDTFFGISINLDKNPKQTLHLIDDLNVKSILIRMPLSDIENIQRYVNFAKQYKDKNLLINILQDRRHVEDLELLKKSLELIFSEFSLLTDQFQLGNAINRKKWAIFSMDEFLRFYKVGYDLRNQKHPNLKLLGSSIIDFEYYFSIRTLFNAYRVKFDQFSSLLYVDRRGAPENTQLGLGLVGKLQFMQAILRLSPKCSNEIVITETNWPITNTHPYAPTSEEDCVSLEDQADFLVRYYLLALTSGVVKNVYWHQLIAPGYGLIDNRNEDLIRYPSYAAFKVMIFMLEGLVFVGTTNKDGVYTAKFTTKENSKKSKSIDVLWCLDETKQSTHKLSISIDTNTQRIISRNGEAQDGDRLMIGSSPTYLITEN